MVRLLLARSASYPDRDHPDRAQLAKGGASPPGPPPACWARIVVYDPENAAEDDRRGTCVWRDAPQCLEAIGNHPIAAECATTDWRDRAAPRISDTRWGLLRDWNVNCGRTSGNEESKRTAAKVLEEGRQARSRTPRRSASTHQAAVSGVPRAPRTSDRRDRAGGLSPVRTAAARPG